MCWACGWDLYNLPLNLGHGDEEKCQACGYTRDGTCLEVWESFRTEPVVVAAYMEMMNEADWVAGVDNAGFDVQGRRKELREILSERWKKSGVYEVVNEP